MSAKNGKPCVKCGANEWTKSGDCAPCTVVRRRQYYERNREEAKEKSRQWREANPERKKANRKMEYANNREKAKASAREWNKLNPERKQETNRKWYQANKEKCGLQSREWSKKNRAKRNIALRRWRHKNPEKVAESDRRTKQAHPEAAAARQNKRRTRKTQAGGSYTMTEWKALVNHYGGKCLCCGRNDVKLTADHVIPVSKGGTSNIDNIQPLCGPCNTRKYDRATDYRPGHGLGRWVQRKLFG